MRVSIKTGHNWVSSAVFLDALREVEAGLRHELGLAAAEHGEDADVARESTLFATNQVRMQASVAILAQARQTNVMLADLVRGVQVGG